MPPAAGGTAPDEGLTGFHPAFRILLLLVLAGMLFRYSLPAMALLLAALLAGAAMAGGDTLRGILRSLRRIRWLLLSIVVIYLWVAPEPPTTAGPGICPAGVTWRSRCAAAACWSCWLARSSCCAVAPRCRRWRPGW
jgi:hypothetical protein